MNNEIKGKTILSVADDTIVLNAIQKEEYVEYKEVLYENLLLACTHYAKSYPDFVKELFDCLLRKPALYYTIREKVNHHFCGYCGIKDVSSAQPELAIELLESKQHQGLGTRAVRLLLQVYIPRNNFEYFRCVVAPDNYPSQHLCEKIGGVPNGIIALILKNPKLQEMIEEANMSMIDDQLQQVAKKFKVKPQKLFSHFLEYKICM